MLTHDFSLWNNDLDLAFLHETIFMKEDDNGNYHFIGKKKKRFIFDKKNFLTHCLKHAALNRVEALENIESALNDYDALTYHKPTGSTNYYKVLRVLNPRYNTQIEACKVYVLPHRRKDTYVIAGACYTRYNS